MRSALLINFLLLVCVAYGQPKKYRFSFDHDAVALIDTNERDTILQRLDGFLAYKNGIAAQNPYVYPEYAKRDNNPFDLFVGVETEGNDTAFYKPTVLAVLPAIRHRQYVLKISYLGVTPEHEARQRILYTLVAEKRSGQYYFFNAFNYNTRHWGKKQVGSIKYIYPNQLDMVKARQMDRFNKQFAKKFSVQVIPITYYRCDDPEQLLKMMGCDYIGNMYFSMSGGFARSWNNTLLAGNNSELYVHELVHFYTAKAFPQNNRIINEGYATYLGGSGGLNLPQTKQLAKRYLDEHPDADITKMFINFDRIQNNIPFTYIASGLICRDVETRYGFKKIVELFKATSDDDYFKRLRQITGVSKERFAGYVKGLINRE